MLTGSDSTPAKANEAKQKNDIGSAKDEVSMFVQNELTDAYEDVYVNGAAGGASTRIGNAVITAVNEKYGTALLHGNAHIQSKTNSTTGNGEVTIWTTDFKVIGTIDKNGGILSWGELTANNGTTQETQTPGATSYKITYNANGGSGEMSATTGTNPEVATNSFTREGYTFVKWNTSTDGSGTDYAVGTTVSSNVTLYAQWSEIVLENTISKATTGNGFVGYYADMDNDGTVDGIIYADLLVGNTESGQWNSDSNSGYDITKITDTTSVKDYVVSAKTYTGQTTAGIYEANEGFGEKEVLVPATNSTGTQDRFYIMALEDFTNNSQDMFYWYYNARGNLDRTIDSEENDFGNGKVNTINMLYDWNNNTETYGEQTTASSEQGYIDLWGAIQDGQYSLVQTTNDSKKWFVPSRAEWSAFAEELGITDSNYSNYGLSGYYWSSSQRSTGGAWLAYFDNGYIYSGTVDDSNWVRLSATF